MAANASPLELTSANFDSTIAGATGPVLVDFWAPWCQPCLMLKPTVNKLADELRGQAVVATLNVDDEPELASRFNITGIPTVIAFKGGSPAAMARGLVGRDQLLALVEKAK